jgi:hypothetical protein
MSGRLRWIVIAVAVVAVAIAGVLLFRGGGTPETASGSPHATVDRADGSDRSRVRLAAKASERLGIRTAAIRPADTSVVKSSPALTVIPYSALIYSADGKTFVYTSPEPMTFVREPVTVDTIDNEVVMLSAGPALGTAVVTVGATELYGLETGIGK